MPNPVVDPQPKPVPGSVTVKQMILLTAYPGVPDYLLVITDCCARMDAAEAKYGSPLMAHNGRDADVDQYQELCDGINYAIQGLIEEKVADEVIGRIEEINDLFQVAIRVRKRLIKKGVLHEQCQFAVGDAQR